MNARTISLKKVWTTEFAFLIETQFSLHSSQVAIKLVTLHWSPVRRHDGTEPLTEALLAVGRVAKVLVVAVTPVAPVPDHALGVAHAHARLRVTVRAVAIAVASCADNHGNQTGLPNYSQKSFQITGRRGC